MTRRGRLRLPVYSQIVQRGPPLMVPRCICGSGHAKFAHDAGNVFAQLGQVRDGRVRSQVVLQWLQGMPAENLAGLVDILKHRRHSANCMLLPIETWSVTPVRPPNTLFVANGHCAGRNEVCHHETVLAGLNVCARWQWLSILVPLPMIESRKWPRSIVTPAPTWTSSSRIRRP